MMRDTTIGRRVRARISRCFRDVMIEAPFDAVASEHIQSLIDNSVSERRTIDYKLELKAGKDEEKKEFLADVSSFANSSSGDLLFGIEEENGIPKRIAGLKDFDADKEILRLEGMLRDAIRPRIPLVHMREVKIPDVGSVLLVRIPKSWSAPHMVVFKGSSRFHGRDNRGKFHMDVDQIRSAFSSSAELPEKIRMWREDRIAKILAGDTPAQLEDSDKIVMHIVPLELFTNPNRLDPSILEQMQLDFPPMGAWGYNDRINLDGFITYGGLNHSHPNSQRSYCQVFRSGCIEAVRADFLHKEDKYKGIPYHNFEDNILRSATIYLRALQKLNVPFPIIVMLTLLGVKGSTIHGEIMYTVDLHVIDREIVVAPELVLEQLPQNFPQAFRPIFNAVWNACGISRSMSYSPSGVWMRAPVQDVPMG